MQYAFCVCPVLCHSAIWANICVFTSGFFCMIVFICKTIACIYLWQYVLSRRDTLLSIKKGRICWHNSWNEETIIGRFCWTSIFALFSLTVFSLKNFFFSSTKTPITIANNKGQTKLSQKFWLFLRFERLSICKNIMRCLYNYRLQTGPLVLFFLLQKALLLLPFLFCYFFL